jgi:hypothetical protein
MGFLLLVDNAITPRLENVHVKIGTTGYFNKWIVLPALLGCLVYFIQLSTNKVDSYWAIFYGVFVTTFSTLFLELWYVRVDGCEGRRRRKFE